MIYAELRDDAALERLESALSEARNRNVSASNDHQLLPSALAELAKCSIFPMTAFRSYIHKYNTRGLEDLMPKSPPGRRGKSHFSANLTGSDFLSKRPISMKSSRRIPDNGRLTEECLFQNISQICVTPPAIHMALRRVGSEQVEATPCRESGSRVSSKAHQLAELTSLRKRQLRSEATRLIVPDTQLRRLCLPPPENRKSRLASFSLMSECVLVSKDRTRLPRARV